MKLQAFAINTYMNAMSMLLGYVMCRLVEVGCKDATKAVESKSEPANLNCVQKSMVCAVQGNCKAMVNFHGVKLL